jgi:hypothetical protein
VRQVRLVPECTANQLRRKSQDEGSGPKNGPADSANYDVSFTMGMCVPVELPLCRFGPLEALSGFVASSFLPFLRCVFDFLVAM